MSPLVDAGENPAEDRRFDEAGLPPGETHRTERRGPLRPASLISTRSRLNSWTLSVLFAVATSLASPRLWR